MGTFIENNVVGKKGERLCKSQLRNHPASIEVTDVTDDPNFRRQGVDFLWQTESANFGVEVKCEKKTTGNLFLETISNCNKATPGWFETSEADLVAYGFLDTGDWNFFELQRMREFVAALSEPLAAKRAKTFSEGGSFLYETEGRLLPLSTAGLDKVIRARILGGVRDHQSGAPTGIAVCHSAHPEWGFGRLVRVEGHHLAPVNQLVLHIEFENRPRRLSIAGSFAIGKACILRASNKQPLLEADLDSVLRTPVSL